MKKNAGFTFLETIIVVAIIAIVVPAFVGISYNLVGSYHVIDPRTRMEEQASLLFSELRSQLNRAQSVNQSASTFASDNGVLVFVDEVGRTIVIDRPNDTVTLGETDFEISRLRFQRAVETAVWLTDPDIKISQWRVDPVQDSEANLTGFVFHIKFEQVNPEAGYSQSASYEAQTTITLGPQVQAL